MPSPASTPPGIWSRSPVGLLQDLIRFDTTNPPGNEKDCIVHIQGILAEAGCESLLLGRCSTRPNLIARLGGRGQAPPLLLHGHVDVVPAQGQPWQHPPFDAEIADGYVWGRGALDMKGGVAMMLTAFLRLKAEGIAPPGDVILALVSDEEAAGEFGTKYLVENHLELFKDIRYAIGEFGGFSLPIAGRRFYPIMVAEKQICVLRATIRGIGGHGALRGSDSAAARLARVLQQLECRQLPLHLTPVAQQMFKEVSSSLPFPRNILLRQLLNPMIAGWLLMVMGEQGKLFGQILRNTVNPTIIRGGDQINVVPSEITLMLDGRLLPGFSPQDLIRHSAAARLARVLQQLECRQLPLHLTPVARAMFKEVSSSLPFPRNILLRQLLNPMIAGWLPMVMGEQGKLFGQILRNTVNPTIIRGGDQIRCAQ